MNEQDVKTILNNCNLSNSAKAIALGYRRKLINVEGKRKSAWVNGDEAFGSVYSVITWHKKYPLGYWHEQLKKTNGSKYSDNKEK